MDSFDDQNFGPMLSNFSPTNGLKEFSHSPVPLQQALDDVDVSDQKILTELEIPKSQTQLNFCKSLTEKLKSETEFPLTQVEPTEIVDNIYPETRDDRYLIPDSTTPAISTEIPRVTRETAISEDSASQEIAACLSDITPPHSADSSSNISSEIAAPLPAEKLDTTSNLPEEEAEITRSRFQQKSNSSGSAVAAKRKADDASICVRPAKQQTCLYHPGMIVWAKITGYSYWPAMIDHDPDVNAYTWPNDSTSDYTHYHVVFFDTNGRLSRSWVKMHYLKLFTEIVKISSSRPRDYIERFKRSVKEAKEAMNLSVEERLKRYSFKERLKLPGTKLCQD